ncbi:hypothetical protein EDB84DRAFT_1117272 [Lactarius hengduanensis]|nr:hypothetical protein EDB84DRAFT_1117272 [Lactarius hengduanensis]
MGQHTYLAPAFIALLALGGQVGLPILVLTFLRSKKLNRRSTFVNFCIAVIIYSLAFCILLYSGQYRRTQPNHALCGAQASMIMGAIPMVGVAALTIVLQLWATFQSPGSIVFDTFERPGVSFILLASPYATFFGYLLGSIVVVAHRPDSVWAHNGLYCFFKLKAIWYYLVPVTCLVVIALTALLEAVIVVEWYLRWRSLKKAFPLADKKAQALVCLRVCLFTVYTWFSLAATFMLREESSPAVPYLFLAGLPLATFLVFATQNDILEAWGIRKAAPLETPPASFDQRATTSNMSSAGDTLSSPYLRESWP